MADALRYVADLAKNNYAAAAPTSIDTHERIHMSPKYKSITFLMLLLGRAMFLFPAASFLLASGCVANVRPQDEKESVDSLVHDLRLAAEQSRSISEINQIKLILIKHGEAAARRLYPLLVVNNERLNESAADILQAIGTPEATDAVIDYCLRTLANPGGGKDDDGPGRFRLYHFGVVAFPKMLQAYRKYAAQPLLREHYRYMMKLVEVSHAMPGDTALPLVQEALSSSYGPVVSVAAQSRGKIGGPGALAELLSLLDISKSKILMSGPNDYRHGVIEGLKLLGNRAAVEPLLNLLIQLGPLSQDAASVAARMLRPPIHVTIVEAIDKLTGQNLRGDVARIRQWLNEQSSQNAQSKKPSP